MQITFDPLKLDEAQVVAALLSQDKRLAKMFKATETSGSISNLTITPGLAQFIDLDDLPDAGKVIESVHVYTPPAPAASAAPLAPDAPLPAAADLFATAPAAPPAGEPSAPSASSPSAPPAPAPAAPSAPAGPATHVHGVEVDIHGLPWDTRIHSSGDNKKNKDGSWRQRRNLADGKLAEVERELRGLMAIPPGGLPLTLEAGQAAAAAVVGAVSTTPAAPSTAPMPPVPPAPSAVDTPSVPAPPVSIATQPTGDAPNVPPAPSTSAPATAPTPTPPAPPAPTAPASTAAPTGSPFPDLLMKMSANVTAGKLTEAQVHAALMLNGVQPGAIASLAARPDLCVLVSQRLDHYLNGGA